MSIFQIRLVKLTLPMSSYWRTLTSSVKADTFSPEKTVALKVHCTSCTFWLAQSCNFKKIESLWNINIHLQHHCCLFYHFKLKMLLKSTRYSNISQQGLGPTTPNLGFRYQKYQPARSTWPKCPAWLLAANKHDAGLRKSWNNFAFKSPPQDFIKMTLD